jgi:hypothetical protein
MEPEGSIPNSQELSTCSYPMPDQSSPHHPIPPSQSLILVDFIKVYKRCNFGNNEKHLHVDEHVFPGTSCVYSPKYL